MVAASFDPTHAVRFDLSQGSVCAGGATDRVLLVPAGALDALVRSATPEAVEALGREIGSSLGRRVAGRMADLQGASIEAFVTELAGQVAVCGFGALSLERWGHALVVVIEESPLVETVFGPIVAAAIEAACGRRVWCTVLLDDDRRVRIFVGSEEGANRVREWQASGTAWRVALARLHGVAS